MQLNKIPKARLGEISSFTQAMLWGLFPIITKESLRSIPTLIVAGSSMLIAAILFAVILTFQKRWHELKQKQVWPQIISVSVTNGCIFYGLVFFGMNYTSSNNVAIILQIQLGKDKSSTMLYG